VLFQDISRPIGFANIEKVTQAMQPWHYHFQFRTIFKKNEEEIRAKVSRPEFKC
jgi:hypothetical protein